MGRFGWRVLVVAGLLQVALGALFIVSVSLSRQNVHASGHDAEVSTNVHVHESVKAASP